MAQSRQSRQQPLNYVWLLYGILLNPVDAFVPTVGLSAGGLIGTSHTTITQDAVKAMDLEFFGFPQLTVAMTKARDEIAAANANVDVTDKHNAPSHFDGESFKDGQDRLISLRKQTKDLLKAGNGIYARQALGQALHTLQDFYSHSNWVEMGNLEINRDILGLEKGANTLQRPARSTVTCRNCHGSLGFGFTRTAAINCQNSCKLGDSPDWKAVASVTCLAFGNCPAMDCSDNLLNSNGLTSGYYSEEGEEYTKPGPHKCSHGGVFDGSASGVEGINKDTNQFTLSPHYELHQEAVQVATQATKQFIREFKNDPEVTKEHLQLLLGAGPSLAFAIDTTGSMKAVIQGVRTAAGNILKSRIGTEDEPVLYVLSQIQDPATGLISTATNADQFGAEIASLRAYGGDDCPELAMSAIQNAIQASDYGGSLFVFTDASAKDVYLAPKVAETAKAKRIKVFPILFPGKCSSAGGFDLIASTSGGQLFSGLSMDEAGTITKLADAVVRANAVDIMSVDTSNSEKMSKPEPNSSGGPRRRDDGLSYSIPVDASMSLLSFSLSGNGARIAVSRPGGDEATPSDPDINQIELSTGSLFTVDKPSPGQWTATISGSSNFSLSATGVSPLHLSSFDFVELQGRPGHTGWFPMRGTPRMGSTSMTLAAIEGNFTKANFELRTRAGNVIAPLNLTAGTGKTNEIALNTFYGNVTVPDKDFVVYLVGEDGTGNEFQRVLPATFAYPKANGTMPGSNHTYLPVPTGGSAGSGPTISTVVLSCGSVMGTCLLLLHAFA